MNKAIAACIVIATAILLLMRPLLAQTVPLGPRFVLPYQTVVDANGVPIPGAMLYFYSSGTNTPLNTYSDPLLTVPNANPLSASSAGVFPNIFMNGNYKIVLTDSLGNQIWTADPVSSAGSSGVPITGSATAGYVPIATGPTTDAVWGTNMTVTQDPAIISCDPLAIFAGTWTCQYQIASTYFDNPAHTDQRATLFVSRLVSGSQQTFGGPQDYALIASAQKINWASNTASGDIQGAYFTAMQGKVGDAAAWTGVAAKLYDGVDNFYQGGALAGQVAALWVDENSNVLMEVQVELAYAEGYGGPTNHTGGGITSESWGANSSVAANMITPYDGLLIGAFDAFGNCPTYCPTFTNALVAEGSRSSAHQFFKIVQGLNESGAIVMGSPSATGLNGSPTQSGGYPLTLENSVGALILLNNNEIQTFEVTSSGLAVLGGSTQIGTLDMFGPSTNYVSIAPVAPSASYNFNLPNTPGSAGQCLASGGGGSAPMTWTGCSGSGSGTVNSGTGGQLTYYATTGAAVSGNADATISNGAVTLGVANSVLGEIILEGSTSGSLTIAPQATAGTPTWTAGTSSGTPAVTASAPLAITTATGNMTCATCVTTAGGQSIGGAGLTINGSAFTATGLVTLSDLATQATNTIVGNATNATASPTALAIGSCSAAADALIWTTNTGFGCNTAVAAPASAITGTTLASNVVTSSLTTVGTLTGGATGSGFTVALGSSTITGQLALTNGGTNASLTASNGGIVYSTGSALAILAGTVTASQCLLSGASSAPTWGACSGGSSGTVNSGTAGNLGYYAASGTAISGNIDANISSGALTLGVANTTQGELILEGATSGALTITTQSVAGTPTWTAGTSSGTPVVTASSPLSITTATGNITISAIPLTDLATQSANTVVANATGSTASPTAYAMTSCSAAGDALIWTPGTGFQCNTSITAAAAPISGLTGAGTGVLTALADNVDTNGGFVTGSTASIAQYALLVGGGSGSAITGIADVASGSVLISGGTGANPFYSANPTVTSITVSAGSAATPDLIVGNSTTGLYSVSTTGFGISVNGTVEGDWGITTSKAWTFAGQQIIDAPTNYTIASTGSLNWDSDLFSAQTLTLTGTTREPELDFFHIKAPTITDSSSETVTNASTIRIDNCPTASGSITITNCNSLLIGSVTTGVGWQVDSVYGLDQYGETRAEDQGAAGVTALNSFINTSGSGYGNNVTGTITWNGAGCTTNPVLNVSTNGSGQIVTLNSVTTAGVCGNGLSFPQPGATTWTAGGGLSAGSGVKVTLVPVNFSGYGCHTANGGTRCLASDDIAGDTFAIETNGGMVWNNVMSLVPQVSSGTLFYNATIVQFSGTVNIQTLASHAGDASVCVGTGTVETAGLLTYDTSGTICGISPLWAKDLATPIDSRDALTKVAGIRTTSWRYKPDYQGTHGDVERVGPIADDIEEMDPRCVSRDDSGRLANYSDRCLETYLVASIKQLKADNDNLRAELAQMQKKSKGKSR
jgi:hypothetical protein